MKNDALANTTAHALHELVRAIQHGATFAQQQAPVLATEIIRWGVIESAVLCGVSLILAVAGAGLWRWAAEEYPKPMMQQQDGKMIAGTLVGIVLFVSGIISLPINLINTLKPIYAPRLYIVEQASHFVGK